MLAAFRSMLKGPGKWVFAGVTLVAFLLVGDFNLDNFRAADAVRVGDQGYSVREVDRAFARRLRTAQQEGGRAITREEAVEGGLLDATVQELATRGAINAEAERLGLTATNEMIQRSLRESGVFDDPLTGEFSAARLQQGLQANNVSPSEFREEMRENIVRDQIIRALGTPSRAPEDLVGYLILRTGERRAIRTAVIGAGDAPEPTEEALRTYYAENQDAYAVPERRTYRVLRIDETTLGEPDIDEADLEQLYASRQGQMGEPERRAYAQAIYPDAASAEAARARVEAGASLAEVAAADGASLTRSDAVTRGAILDPAVGEAVFAAEAPGVVGPVEGTFGTVLAELIEIVPGTQVPYEEAREGLLAEFREEVMRERVFEAVEAIEDALDEGMDLEEAAREAGLDGLRSYGPVDADLFTDEGAISDVPGPAHRRAFVLEEGEQSDAVALDGSGGGGYAYVVLDRIEPSRARPFEDVEAELRVDYARQATGDALAAAVDRFRASVEAGTSFEDAASLAGSAVQETVIAARAPDPSLPPAFLQDVFSARPGAIVSATAAGQDQALVAIIDEVSFAEDPAAAGLVAAYRDRLGQNVTQELVNTYLDALLREEGVTRNEELLNRQFRDG